MVDEITKDTGDEWITMTEAAKRAGVTPRAISAAVRRRALEARVGLVPGRGKMVLISARSVRDYKRGAQGRLSPDTPEGTYTP